MARSPDDIYDELLVLRCQDGDSVAMQELVERWQNKLIRHAARLTQDRDAALEVVQDSWMAVVRGIHRIKDASRFRPWIYRIVGRRATDWIRQQARNRKTLEEVATQTPNNKARESLEQKDAIATLRAALKELPETRRIVLSMLYLEEMSVAEIAHVLGVPSGTIKSRLFHARNQLKLVLKRTDS